MKRCVVILGLVVGAACGPGAPADTTTTTGSASDGSSGAPLTGGPVVTSSQDTTNASTPTSTSGPDDPPPATSGTTFDEPASTDTGTATSEVSATTSGTGDASSTTGPAPCQDTDGEEIDTDQPPSETPHCEDPQIEWDQPHLDCRIDCSTATNIHGQGPAAGIPTVTQVTFGIATSNCGEGVALRSVRLGGLAKPTVDIGIFLECGLDPWIGDHVIHGKLPDQTPFDAIMTIESHAGDWFAPDPTDSPRLLGSFSGDLVGPFEAIHCAKLDTGQHCE